MAIGTDACQPRRKMEHPLGGPSVLRVIDANDAVWFAERGFQQASGVTLTKPCRRNNSSGDHFTRHIGLIDVT
jgi:hypothetical protein